MTATSPYVEPWPDWREAIRAAVAAQLRDLSQSLLAWLPSRSDRSEIIKISDPP